jgi:hypothetical protein
MTDVDSNEIEFQYPSCGNDLKLTMARLKVDRHMICPGCSIGINIDADRMANAAEEIQKTTEKSPPEITIKFFR